MEVLETIFEEPSDDREEQMRRDGLLQYVTVPPLDSRLSSSRKFKDIERQLRLLSGKSALQQFAEHVQDKDEVSALLEDLKEAISDYQVGSRTWRRA